MRGYFAMGVEGISKPMNLGNLLRSAHAFGASFFFTIAPTFQSREVRQSDTSDAAKHLPLYTYDSVAELQLPRGCTLVGVELTEDAVELPSFHHPTAAAYVLGPERGSLSPALAARCDDLLGLGLDERGRDRPDLLREGAEQHAIGQQAHEPRAALREGVEGGLGARRARLAPLLRFLP
jgi:tRNA(Leu) C34 or U34 (ribose-2'-O)-methylase TrmL